MRLEKLELVEKYRRHSIYKIDNYNNENAAKMFIANVVRGKIHFKLKKEYLSNVNEWFTVGVANDDETNNWLIKPGEALKRGDRLALFNKFGEELFITVDSIGKPVCNEKFLRKVSESLKKENN